MLIEFFDVRGRRWLFRSFGVCIQRTATPWWSRDVAHGYGCCRCRLVVTVVPVVTLMAVVSPVCTVT